MLLIADERQTSLRRKCRGWVVDVEVSVQQAPGREVISKPLVCNEDYHLGIRVLQWRHFLNEDTFCDQSPVERSREAAPGKEAVDDFSCLHQSKPRLAGVDDYLRNGFHSLSYEWSPGIEIKCRRQPLVDRTEIQVEYGCDALKAAREATLTLRIETPAQRLEKQRVLELRRKKRRRWKLQAVVEEERLGGIVLMPAES